MSKLMTIVLGFIAFVIIILLLAGCTAAEEDTYLQEMRAINDEMSTAVNLFQRTIENITDPDQVETLSMGIYQLIEREYEKFEDVRPPRNFVPEHNSYRKFIEHFSDAALAAAKGDTEMLTASVGIAVDELDKAEPLIEAMYE